MGKPKEASVAKQKTLFSFFGPGQGPSKVFASSVVDATKGDPKKPAPAASKLVTNFQVDAETTEPKRESPRVAQPLSYVLNGGSRSQAASVSPITTKNIPRANNILMGDDNGEVEEEYRPVSIVASPLRPSLIEIRRHGSNASLLSIVTPTLKIVQLSKRSSPQIHLRPRLTARNATRQVWSYPFRW
jgi:hypothetical protein